VDQRHPRCAPSEEGCDNAMPRIGRQIVPGCVQHVINRGNRRECIFQYPHDYREFLRLLRDAGQRFNVSLFVYCAMPNHFHLVLRPNERRALSAYMHWLTSTQVRRLHRRNGTVGEGHIYQERYRTVAVASDIQFLNVCRYVEANPVRAGLVDRADEWPYSSASGDDCGLRPRLDPWPIPKPECWADLVGCP
jgi:putative transposase